MKKHIVMLLALVLIAFLSYIKGSFDADMRHDDYVYAARSLKKTGLPTECAPSYCLHGFAGSRDSFTQVKFIVDDPFERSVLLKQMKCVKGWHVTPVDGYEYLEFQNRYMWTCSAVLDVPEDIVFDAWYYHETREGSIYSEDVAVGAFSEIGRIGRGYEFAVYDSETGLFVFVDQFG